MSHGLLGPQGNIDNIGCWSDYKEPTIIRGRDGCLGARGPAGRDGINGEDGILPPGEMFKWKHALMDLTYLRKNAISGLLVCHTPLASPLITMILHLVGSDLYTSF